MDETGMLEKSSALASKARKRCTLRLPPRLARRPAASRGNALSPRGPLLRPLTPWLARLSLLALSSRPWPAQARTAGAKVFHAPISFKEDASDNPNKGSFRSTSCSFCERVSSRL